MPLSEDRYGVHFTSDGELLELLERVRGLAAHRLPTGDLPSVMKRALRAYQRELEKDRFAVGRKARAPRVDEQGAPRRSRIRRQTPASVARQVYARDDQRCAFVSAGGRRCSSRWCLQIDHSEPFAWHGDESLPNQRLLCRAHNQQHARRCFGVSFMRSKVEQGADARTSPY